MSSIIIFASVFCCCILVSLKVSSLVRNRLQRFSYSSLNLRPIDGSKPRHAPFVCTFYLDTREGSYISFGRHVHRTLMLKAADKPNGDRTSTGGRT